MAHRPTKARVLTCYYRPKPGGFCKRLFRAIEALLAEGHSVHYVAVVAFPIAHDNCHFHRFRWPERRTEGLLFWIVFNLVAPIQLAAIALRYRATHLFAFGTNYAWLLQPARWLRGSAPLTLFVRADTLLNHQIKNRGIWIIALDSLIEGWSIQGARLYGVSKALTDTITRRHPRAKLAGAGMLPNDMPAVHVAPKLSPLRQPLQLANVGVMETRKNQMLLLRTMQSLDPCVAQLRLYGTGPDEIALRQAAHELGIEDRVSFMGWIEPATRIWAETDLLLFPSLHEGSPNAVLEALAHGVPVLASDIPEHREFLPPSCLLPATDESAWNAALKRLLQDPTRGFASMRTEQELSSRHLRFNWDERVRTLILQ